ncbi:tRNA (adenosine(37)-N6)-dimethylallyltransferase MiaA [Lentisphaerota bacterium WC36G]|nr:tRNA (adenosine(37)-N6)-dimethylallyltransferase MiaA [Lentisphaerae bacterium WC36]
MGSLLSENPILVIAGPTASGKSSLAVEVAKEFDGEIITADSMQLYKYLDIGTAKPSVAEQEGIKHHLIDILEITEGVDVYDYLARAEKLILEIQSRGKLPIVAGGTGFYIKSLLYGLDNLPGDEKIREKLFAKYDNDEKFGELLEIMTEKSPNDAKKWAQHRRKLIRAYEIFLLTGKSLIELQTLEQPQLRYKSIVYTLNWDRAILRERIFKRTKIMLQQGWIEEGKNLIENMNLFDTPTAHQVLGYKQIAAYLNGEINIAQLEEQIATKTWQYARRQLTWFKKQHPEAIALEMPIADKKVFFANLKEKLQDA